MDSGTWTFDATLFPWHGSSWFLVALPQEVSDEIEEQHEPHPTAFGAVRVEVRCGTSTWRTSLFPSTREQSYVLPVRRSVRRAEGLHEGVTGTFTVRTL